MKQKKKTIKWVKKAKFSDLDEAIDGCNNEIHWERHQHNQEQKEK